MDPTVNTYPFNAVERKVEEIPLTHPITEVLEEVAEAAVVVEVQVKPKLLMMMPKKDRRKMEMTFRRYKREGRTITRPRLVITTGKIEPRRKQQVE